MEVGARCLLMQPCCRVRLAPWVLCVYEGCGEGNRMKRDLSEYAFSDWSVASSIAYLGFVKDVDTWYIQKVDLSNKWSKYAFGDHDYQTNWTNRASLTYAYYDEAA